LYFAEKGSISVGFAGDLWQASQSALRLALASPLPGAWQT
jgi:hypothetical protein